MWESASLSSSCTVIDSEQKFLSLDHKHNTMSLKYAVEKHSESHYVLPRVGKMRVHVDAFLSESLYEL
ncbi:MAG TPA: hypothetical protein VHO25_16835 [Polyangiaceae bacterium]|nr:hypothetical protein [Polyangiaceae bacterium]